MTSRLLTIRSKDMTGKKGRLTAEALAEIAGRYRLPCCLVPFLHRGQKYPGKTRTRADCPLLSKAGEWKIRKSVGTGAARHAGSVILPIR